MFHLNNLTNKINLYSSFESLIGDGLAILLRWGLWSSSSCPSTNFKIILYSAFASRRGIDWQHCSCRTLVLQLSSTTYTVYKKIILYAAFAF